MTDQQSADFVEKIRKLKADGLRQFSFEARYGHELEMLEDWAEVFALV